jgi:hypothetical protein
MLRSSQLCFAQAKRASCGVGFARGCNGFGVGPSSAGRPTTICAVDGKWVEASSTQ